MSITVTFPTIKKAPTYFHIFPKMGVERRGERFSTGSVQI
jgi:hypothetical protein